MIIAIDGFSACGKSTLAKQLADELGYLYIDTGAMYRAITLYFLNKKVDPHDEEAVNRALEEISLDFEEREGNFQIQLNGEVVEDQIRGNAVTGKVSEIAALKEVRDFAVAQQRKMSRKGGVVMDGRDIGTVVFPKAELKIFLTAEPEIRVERRFLELRKKNPAITKEEVRKSLERRDFLDTHRAISPLVKADDAILLNNSRLSREEQLAEVLNLARSRMG